MKVAFESQEYGMPREKIARSGISALTDIELLATMLGSGSGKKGVFVLAKEILPVIEGGGDLIRENLLKIGGMGEAKVSALLAALEFGRRRIRPSESKISGPEDVYGLVRYLADRKQEHFIVTSLNGANEVIKTRIVTIGLVSSTQIHPREVFSDPLKDRASAIVVSHNHPSGSLIPSQEDKAVTEQLKECGRLLGIKLLDHVIFSSRGFVSFSELGLLNEG